MKLKYLVFAFIVACNPFEKDGKITDPNFCTHSPSCQVQDNTVPKILNVILPVDGEYISGSDLVFKFEMDSSVTIVDNLKLKLKIGRHEKEANCSLSNSFTLNCAYTLSDAAPTPDLDFDGINVIEFDTTNGNVKGTNGVIADLTITPMHLENVYVYYSNFDSWLDALDISTLFSDSTCTTTITQNANVACWVDKRSGQPFINSTAANKPQYRATNGPNSTPTVFFSNSFLTNNNSVAVGTQFTVILVYNVTAFNTLNYFIGSLADAAPGIGIGFGGTWTGGPAGNGLFLLTKSTLSSSSLVSTLEPTAWGVSSYQAQKIFRNQTEALPYAATQTAQLPQSFKYIGRREDNNSCCVHTGNVSEMLIFNQTLGTEQLQEVWCHLSNKYGFNFNGC